MKQTVFKSIVERLYDGFFNKEEEKNYIELEKQQIIDFTKKIMDKEFIPYEQALALKELGFNETCLGNYRLPTNRLITEWEIRNTPESCLGVSAPTFSQVFRWFREKYDVYHFVTREVGINTSDIFFVASYYKGKKGNSPKDTCVSSRTYEEAELECLKKLIEIVK